jgi:hypothetical protein
MAKKNYGIPDRVLSELIARDKSCVYCQKTMIYTYQARNCKDFATIEHLKFGGPVYWSEGLREDGIVICCMSCNSSRGSKKLTDWFKSRYCIDRNINTDTVAESVKIYLQSDMCTD